METKEIVISLKIDDSEIISIATRIADAVMNEVERREESLLTVRQAQRELHRYLLEQNSDNPKIKKEVTRVAKNILLRSK